MRARCTAVAVVLVAAIAVACARIEGPPTVPTVPAGSVDASSASSTFHVGDLVEVEWRGSWWPATIVDQQSADEWLIHYEGYGEEWDEAVDTARIRARQAGGTRTDEVEAAPEEEDERP